MAFQEAKQHISYGTRVVDLDGQRIFVNMPDEELDSEAVPTPIVSFFNSLLSLIDFEVLLHHTAFTRGGLSLGCLHPRR